LQLDAELKRWCFEEEEKGLLSRFVVEQSVTAATELG